MENYPSNNNNHLQILDPMPIKACPPSSDQSSSSTQQNVESSFSSVTPLRNNRMYDPKMNRLTDVKRLARNRRKSYPKYGPYPCQWCIRILKTSQSFAGHMRAHYRRIETAARKAAKQAQQQQQQEQLLTPEQQQAKALDNNAQYAREQLVKSRTQAKKLARVIAQMNAKVEAQAQPKPRAQAPEPKPTPTPVASGSEKQPLRTNDCHLRLSNCQFGQIISPGNKNNSVSTESISNALDFISFKQKNAVDFNLYSIRRPIIQNSSSAYVLHHHHNLRVPPGLASSSRSRPCIDVNKKPPVVKQEVFRDKDVKPPPGFHIKEERVVFDDDDDDVVECVSLDSLALKL